MTFFSDRARWIYEVFQDYPALDADGIHALNVYYTPVDVAGDDGDLCYFNCNGYQRLLCCDTYKVRLHARSKCGVSGAVYNTVVVHNSYEYGGAGYQSLMVGTTSIHPSAPQVAVHELGHSLFGLADEYTYGWGRSNDPNCANTGCTKWSDLMSQGWGVGCIAACENSNYFASELTFMQYLSYGFEEVNERIACCKYMYYYPQVVPNFCQKFNVNGLDVLSYCQSEIWGGSGPSFLETNATRLARLQAQASDHQGTHYTLLSNAVQWTLSRVTGTWECTQTSQSSASGVYVDEEVKGDFAADLVIHNMHGPMPTITVHIIDEQENVLRALTYNTKEFAEIPPAVDHWEDGDYEVDRETIILELSEGERCVVMNSA